MSSALVVPLQDQAMIAVHYPLLHDVITQRRLQIFQTGLQRGTYGCQPPAEHREQRAALIERHQAAAQHDFGFFTTRACGTCGAGAISSLSMSTCSHTHTHSRFALDPRPDKPHIFPELVCPCVSRYIYAQGYAGRAVLRRQCPARGPGLPHRGPDTGAMVRPPSIDAAIVNDGRVHVGLVCRQKKSRGKQKRECICKTGKVS